jgi:hypothetical protein
MNRMKRNTAFAAASGVMLLGASSLLTAQTQQKFSADKLGVPTLRDPVSVYNNWSSYDELSDNIPLTQDLAMRELNEVIRLRKLGVRFDYYMMDAFWVLCRMRHSSHNVECRTMPHAFGTRTVRLQFCGYGPDSRTA